MIKRISLAILLLCLVSSLMLPLAGAALQDEKKPTLSEEDQKAMEMLEKMAMPGENHKHLGYFVGEWESDVKMIGEPGEEPLASKQRITVKWLLGGRYLRAHIRGDLMGKKYDVLVFTGYDNYNKTAFQIQLSSMDTGYFISSGSFSKDGKIKEETGMMDEPGGKKTKVRAVTTILDNNRYKYDFYITRDGKKEKKAMEIMYRRKTSVKK